MNAMAAEHAQLETAVKEQEQKAAQVRAELEAKRMAAITQGERGPGRLRTRVDAQNWQSKSVRKRNAPPN